VHGPDIVLVERMAVHAALIDRFAANRIASLRRTRHVQRASGKDRDAREPAPGIDIRLRSSTICAQRAGSRRAVIRLSRSASNVAMFFSWANGSAEGRARPRAVTREERPWDDALYSRRDPLGGNLPRVIRPTSAGDGSDQENAAYAWTS